MPGVPMPQLDVGTFAVERIGGPTHPVGFAWVPPGASYEVWALYHTDNPWDGFVRPGAVVPLVGCTFNWIPSSADPTKPLLHGTQQAFIDWIVATYMLEPWCLDVLRGTTVDPPMPGTGVYPMGVLRPGVVKVRETAAPADDKDPEGDVRAMAWHPAPDAPRETWRLKGGPKNPFKKPGAAHPRIDLWFSGYPATDYAAFLATSDGILGGTVETIHHRID